MTTRSSKILRRWLIALLPLAAAAILLQPLPESERWDIIPDPALAAGKSRYLGTIADRPDGSLPNILLIVADDLGRYDVGAQPDLRRTLTPHIDALARRGTTFSNAYATAAICAPSRAALLTGRYQNRFGFESQPMQRYVRNLGEFLAFRYLIDTDQMRPFLLDAYPNASQRSRQGLPPTEITLGEVLRARGYRTAIVGKWHLGYSAANHPTRFGFERQYGFLEAFTLYAPETDPAIVSHHHPLFWEEHIWEMGRSGPSAITRNGSPIDEPRYLTDAIVEETLDVIDVTHAGASARGAPFFAYVPFSAPHTPFQARRQDYEEILDASVDGAIDHNRRVYLAMIRRLDAGVGKLVEHLQSIGELDNTLIVFTSDNGGAAYTEATDNGPLRGGKFTQFEGGLAVPLIVAGPGARMAAIDSRPALLTDLFATLLAQLGVPLPNDRTYDSVDLLTPASASQPRERFWRSDYNRAVRIGRWKLIENTHSGSVQLFDLSDDPAEQHDRAALEPARIRALKAALDRWEATLAVPLWPRVMDYLHEDDAGQAWFAI